MSAGRFDKVRLILLAGGAFLFSVYAALVLSSVLDFVVPAGELNRKLLSFGLSLAVPDNFRTRILAQGPMVFCLWLMVIYTFMILRRRMADAERQDQNSVDVLYYISCVAVGFFLLMTYGSEQPWYPLEKLMTFSGPAPFQHRIFFLLPAVLTKHIVPTLAFVDAYLLSQIPALFAALWAVKKLANLCVESRYTFVAQFLFLCIWAPSITYFTFYDIGIVFFYAVAVYLLLTARYGLYVIAFAVGTLNHEITLFLVIISVSVLYGKISLRRLVAFSLLQLIVYGVIRYGLFISMPVSAAWESGKMQFNINLLLTRQRDLIINLGPLLLFGVIAAFGFSFASLALRRCLVLLPCLIFMTFVVGQLHEARQFDAFIPVMICYILLFSARYLKVKVAETSCQQT